MNDFEKDDVIEVKIEDMGVDGEGIGRRTASRSLSKMP